MPDVLTLADAVGTDIAGVHVVRPQIHGDERGLFIETYRELPLLSWPREILAGLIEVEQAFLIFRQRHARMVERVIGRRVGTGGSAGVEYLDRTALEYRVFRDLWATRTLLLKGEAAPPLERAGYYDFAQGDLSEG